MEGVVHIYILSSHPYPSHTRPTHTMAGGDKKPGLRRKSNKNIILHRERRKKANKRCPGCLHKSCPKKFNIDENKCGESYISI